MDPLKDPNVTEVVFDKLSYTAGPLFEQLLQDINGSTVSKRKIYGSAMERMIRGFLRKEAKV